RSAWMVVLVAETVATNASVLVQVTRLVASELVSLLQWTVAETGALVPAGRLTVVGVTCNLTAVGCDTVTGALTDRPANVATTLVVPDVPASTLPGPVSDAIVVSSLVQVALEVTF